MKRILENDLKKLADAFYKELTFEDSFEYGSPSLDFKRPFGNSDVEGDILKILDWNPEGDDGDSVCFSRKQKEYARDLYAIHLVPYLKKKWIESKKYSKEENQEYRELMVEVPVSLLRSVLEAAEDNRLECLNQLLDSNKGYLHIGKGKALKEMYETEKSEIQKLNILLPNQSY